MEEKTKNKKSNFTVEKLGKHSLSQMKTNVHINSDKGC